MDKGWKMNKEREVFVLIEDATGGSGNSGQRRGYLYAVCSSLAGAARLAKESAANSVDACFSFRGPLQGEDADEYYCYAVMDTDPETTVKRYGIFREIVSFEIAAEWKFPEEITDK